MIESGGEAMSIDELPNRTWSWHQFESTVSVFFAFVVGFVVAVLGGGLVYFGWKDPEARWWGAVWLIVLAAEVAFLRWLKLSLERGDLRPFIPHFALRQMRWPILLGPVVALFWLAHFALALGALLLVEQAVVLGSGEIGLAPFMALLALSAWILTHCGLMYLLLGVTALGRSEILVMTLWRWRLAIDLVFALTVTAMSSLLRR
jgi:hypothetical protein